MTLGELLGIEDYTEVCGFALDHRKIGPGDIFGAFRGARFNGELVIPDAVAAGAVGIVCAPDTRVDGAVAIHDPHPRRRFAQLASRFYGPYPDILAAVTGTNGKTSVADLTRQLWAHAGLEAASVGTLGVGTAAGFEALGMTTPDIISFLKILMQLRRRSVSHAIFEASSHGLDQYRSEGIPLKAAAFTNLTRDHLDYHGTMEDYRNAKLRLFSDCLDQEGIAVISADDPEASVFEKAARDRGIACLTVGYQGQDLHLLECQPLDNGQRLTIDWRGEQVEINLPLIGAYQAENALVAAGLALATGVNDQQVQAGLSRLQPVRGRLELAVRTQQDVPVYVDYAHTPDGLRAALEALRPHATNRLIVVFGAGGDRDPGKRPLMGEVASRLADVVIVTDDNPRTEEAATIRAAVMDGVREGHDIGDRRTAIKAAMDLAQTGDVILIAGKGHEQGQIVGTEILPFDDVTVAQECAA